MEDQFIRTRMLLGANAMERLGKSHVAVLGLGGVGSWCAEALCRSGVGELTLVDQDTVSVSNLNRQAAAVWSTVGMEKTQAAAQRLAGIAPGCLLHPLSLRYEAGTREEFFQARYDYIVDAIDLVSCKLDLIETAHARAVAARWPGWCARSCAAGAFPAIGWYSPPSRPMPPGTGTRHPRPGGGPSLPAPCGFRRRLGCYWPRRLFWSLRILFLERKRIKKSFRPPRGHP